MKMLWLEAKLWYYSRALSQMPVLHPDVGYVMLEVLAAKDRLRCAGRV